LNTILILDVVCFDGFFETLGRFFDRSEQNSKYLAFVLIHTIMKSCYMMWSYLTTRLNTCHILCL